MNKLSTIVAQFAISAPCLIAAFLLINTVPAIRHIEISINGWGWGIFIACTLAMKFVLGRLSGLVKGLLVLRALRRGTTPPATPHL